MRPYLPRQAEQYVGQLARQFPAVAIVGPRQVGKTSLAQHLAAQWPGDTVYLDLETPADFNKLKDKSRKRNGDQLADRPALY